MLHWLAYWTGLTNASGPVYLFWSGIAGDLGLLGAILALYHKHNCHNPWCWRIGKHSVNGTPYCTRHHPKGI